MYKARLKINGSWVVIKGVALVVARFFGEDAEEDANLFASIKNERADDD